MSYLSKERALEVKWSSLLTRDNVSDAMDNPANVNKLAANWKQIFSSLSGEDIDFHSLESLSKQLLELCQTRKWYKTLSPEDAISLDRDVKVYVAYLVWDIKRVNNNICSEKYWRLASERHFARCSRRFSHEAINYALKLYEGKLDPETIKVLTDAFSQKFELLWKGENKLISLPVEQGDYIQLPGAETINESMEGAA